MNHNHAAKFVKVLRYAVIELITQPYYFNSML